MLMKGLDYSLRVSVKGSRQRPKGPPKWKRPYSPDAAGRGRRGTPKCCWPLLNLSWAVRREAAAAPCLSTVSPSLPVGGPPYRPSWGHASVHANALPSSGVYRAVSLLSPGLHNSLRPTQRLMNQICTCISSLSIHSPCVTFLQSPTARESAGV